MNSRYKRSITAITLLLLLAVMQAYAGIGLAARDSSSTDSWAAPQQVSGILTTQGNKPIMVNGASAATGATILNGAVIETPDGVKATINVPGHGVISIAGNSRLTITFDDSGNIRIALAAGCVVLETMKGTTGEINNPQGVIGKTDPSQAGRIDTCPTRTAPAAAADGGLSTGAKVGIGVAVAGGVGIGLALALRGSNPSPGAP